MILFPFFFAMTVEAVEREFLHLRICITLTLPSLFGGFEDPMLTFLSHLPFSWTVSVPPLQLNSLNTFSFYIHFSLLLHPKPLLPDLWKPPCFREPGLLSPHQLPTLTWIQALGIFLPSVTSSCVWLLRSVSSLVFHQLRPPPFCWIVSSSCKYPRLSSRALQTSLFALSEPYFLKIIYY